MLSKTEIKKILQAEDLKVLKSLGQNFLVDEKVLKEIIKASELNENDLVIEVGPGLGTLTNELLKKCGGVIAVEKDRKMSCWLHSLHRSGAVEPECVAFANRLHSSAETMEPTNDSSFSLINDDILKINLNELIFSRQSPLRRDSDGADSKKYKLISNIPYYITSPVIKLFLENSIQPELIVLLIQKEVAERICAKPGKLSILALSVQMYGEPEIISYIKNSSFYPEPKVDSAILRIKNIKKEFPDEYYRKLFKIIKIGFSSKRKKLINNLSAGLHLSKEDASQILSKANINPNARAQELSLEEWEGLVNNL